MNKKEKKMETPLFPPKKDDKDYFYGIIKTIRMQLKYPIPSIFWSWGCYNFEWGVTKDQNPSLRFRTNGGKFEDTFSGFVTIIYVRGLDTYRVEISTPRSHEIKFEMDDVYFDCLQPIIDKFIMKDFLKKENKKKVNS